MPTTAICEPGGTFTNYDAYAPDARLLNATTAPAGASDVTLGVGDGIDPSDLYTLLEGVLGNAAITEQAVDSEVEVHIHSLNIFEEKWNIEHEGHTVGYEAAKQLTRESSRHAIPLNQRLKDVSFLVGHGTFMAADGETFVPEGTTIRFGAQEGKKLAAIAGLASLQSASVASYGAAAAGQRVRNYRLGMHTPTEVQSDIDSLNSLNASAERVIVVGERPSGKSTPKNVIFTDSTKLCTSVDHCRQLEWHDCEGILGKYEGEIVILACLAVSGDNEAAKTTVPAYDKGDDLEIVAAANRYLESVYKRWKNRELTATEALEALNGNSTPTGALAKYGTVASVFRIAADAHGHIANRGSMEFLVGPYMEYSKQNKERVWCDPSLKASLRKLGLTIKSVIKRCPCSKPSKFEVTEFPGAECAVCKQEITTDCPQVQLYVHLGIKNSYCLQHSPACPPLQENDTGFRGDEGAFNNLNVTDLENSLKGYS
ncbi:hypothetical protein OTB20_41125 [Streptomyces sp. H27-H1]|uniref:putative adhesin n=1 Tax=Streptomyces sp. H27-H1 TaxID=2996461 RepID=UPI00226E1765|nr:hypothetical protein [Streptomyces sp. H27-H1]MCY0932437.1 hypothetical protein [Streptomyces sp. H27-H1]